jgi:hypothetical protein
MKRKPSTAMSWKPVALAKGTRAKPQRTGREVLPWVISLGPSKFKIVAPKSASDSYRGAGLGENPVFSSSRQA